MLLNLTTCCTIHIIRSVIGGWFVLGRFISMHGWKTTFSQSGAVMKSSIGNTEENGQNKVQYIAVISLLFITFPAWLNTLCRENMKSFSRLEEYLLKCDLRIEHHICPQHNAIQRFAPLCSLNLTVLIPSWLIIQMN